jgi:hypothetical protein
MTLHDDLVDVGGLHGVERLQRAVVDDEEVDTDEPAHLGLMAVVEARRLEHLQGAGLLARRSPRDVDGTNRYPMGGPYTGVT